jgi:hypothetical protein
LFPSKISSSVAAVFHSWYVSACDAPLACDSQTTERGNPHSSCAGTRSACDLCPRPTHPGKAHCNGCRLRLLSIVLGCAQVS